ncbi:TraB/GumN family protein [Paenibacillus sp. LHD-117]|uniref:TraB/GumN family protein n=1 Tax=Paenibacillus sp. LHD-117 TaxID=3071412 RepID=UPI0027DFECF4|nr:TraB/GumN family protein [Paenibacillus sp. LHD-117]MDQ6422294.1 TraB/GumN family protein [Paenibacillus sp. LHD-117]
MFKRLSALLFAAVLFFSLASGTQASAQPLKVWLGNEEIQFGDKQPIIENNTTLVPARALLEDMGYEIEWDGEAGTVQAVKEQSVLTFTIGEAIATVNGQPVELTIAPKIKDGTAYVPLRFVGESTGHQVRWDGASRSVVLAQSKGFFWKVEKDGTEVYLLGSIHVGNDYLYPMRPEIEAAFENADQLVVEVNVAKPVSEEQVKQLQSYMMYDDGSVLPDHISAETYDKLKAILKEIGAPENAFDPYKPWQIVNELTVVKAAQSGYQAGLGIDMYFLQRAMGTGLPIAELESYDQQFAMFSGFSSELQAQMLKDTVEQFHKMDGSIAALANLWSSGDETQLIELMNSIGEQQEYYKTVIQDRNAGMLEKIEGYLNGKDQSTSFIVAGYLHMLGEHGIVTMLEEKGYTVTHL